MGPHSGGERLSNSQVPSSIPEARETNSADEVVLIIDGAAERKFAESCKIVDDRRNGKDVEEGGVVPSTGPKSELQPRDVQGQGETICSPGIAESAASENLRGPVASSSISVTSDAIEIDCNDRKTEIDSICNNNNNNNNNNSRHSHEGGIGPRESQQSIQSPEETRDVTSTIRSTVSRSAFSKPKSRFVGSDYPTSLTVAEENTPLMAMRGRSSMHRSATAPEEEEEDSFRDDDLPDDYRKWKIGVRLLAEWIAFVVLMAGMVSTLTMRRLEHRSIWGLALWKWCLMILAVFCGRLVSGWLIGVLVFLVERNLLLRKRVLYFVYGLRGGLQNCLWLGMAIVAWTLMFDPKVERSVKNHRALSHVTRLLTTFLLAAVIWLLKILLVKVMASRFHVNTYFDRIQESIFHQCVLAALSGPPVMEIRERKLNDRKRGADVAGRVSLNTAVGTRSTAGIRQRFKGCGGNQESAIPNVEQLHKMNQKNVSAWNMKRLINVIRHSRMSTISNTIDESMSGRTVITSELEAKAAAGRIFKNVAKPGANYIEEEDLLRFMKKNEVASVFPQFEGALDSGKIKKSALKNWVVKVYLERKSLGHSLNDTKTAVDQLHQVANAVVIPIIIVVSLLVLGIATTHVIVLLSSQLLLVGFMFGNTCKTVFEAIVFVFIMHPFDVGDRCVVDGVQMIVEEMNILSTVFLRYDNEKIYYPNTVLATKPISNFYRSPDMGDAIEFCVDVSIPMEKIAMLKERIAKYIESKSQHWHPKHSVVVKEIENMNKMRMALYTLHTMNHQNMGEKSNRRSDLVLEMKKIFEELGIEYHVLPQEVHVSIAGSMTNQIPLQC